MFSVCVCVCIKHHVVDPKHRKSSILESRTRAQPTLSPATLEDSVRCR